MLHSTTALTTQIKKNGMDYNFGMDYEHIAAPLEETGLSIMLLHDNNHAHNMKLSCFYVKTFMFQVIIS